MLPQTQPTLVQYLWDALIVGVCLVNHEGTIIQMNVAASRLLGWGAVSPPNLSIYDVVEGWEPDEGVRSTCPSVLSMIQEKKIGWFPRIRVQGRQKSWCWVEIKGVVIEEEGMPQFLFMFRDLSSETRLAEEYSRLASIPEESPFPIIEVDTAGHLLYANPSMVSLMEEAHIGHDGFTTALPQHFSDLAARCFAQGYLESNIEVQVGEKHYAWSFSSHPELGRLRGYGMDITDSKRASEELAAFAETLETKNQELDQALVKAEDATRAKAAFLATMSHEIRTPLNGVIGMAELLLNSSLNVEQQDCLNIIRKSGEGLLEIINDILDFSKIESGYMAVEAIEFNPLVLVEEAVDLFSERAYKKTLDIAAYVAPDIPRYLLGDPHRLRQILCNFISNALKFTSYGSVLIEVEWLSDEKIQPYVEDNKEILDSEQSLERTMGFIRFAVKDTGIGISQEAQPRIFQVFTQADSSMSRKFGGSGLGLAICKQLAELMGGAVGVDSQMGCGATFWCDLPFPLHSWRSEVTVEARNRQDEILLCFLSGATTDVLVRYLEEQGLKVRRAERVQDVNAIFNEHTRDPSRLLGIIMGANAQTEDWQSWLTTIQQRVSSTIKLWGLTPFWMRKEHADSMMKLDGIITMPLHREQLYHCVFGTAEALEEERFHRDIRVDEATDAGQETVSSLIPLVAKCHENQQGIRPSVLIVEDNAINQKVASGLFEQLGCQVYVAECGDRALTLVQEHHIDVVMMDWELPGMDGFEVAKAIRELEQANCLKPPESLVQKAMDLTPMSNSHLPIVGMTAHGHASCYPSRWEYVMDDCISKPIHLQDLVSVLERWIGVGRQAFDQQVSSSHNSGAENLSQNDLLGLGERVNAWSDLKNVSEGYNFSSALEHLEGNEALLFSLFEIFLETWPVLATSIRESVIQQNRQDIQRYAHQAKGALYALHASQQASLAGRLEQQSTQEVPFSDIVASWEGMEQEMNTLMVLFRKALHSKK